MTDFAASATSRDGTSKLSLLSNLGGTLRKNTTKLFSGTKGVLSKKNIGILVALLFVIGALGVGWRAVKGRTAATSGTQSSGVAPDALTTSVEREFSFNVYDQQKELSDPVRYTITTAQLTKQIIIKGQKANAVNGRTFLILNLKLVNDFDKSLFLNTRNYLRVQPAGTDDRLAAEIHNDTVEVQPLSTKLTRIGLPVDDGIKDFTLYVGELEGEKEAINITFP